MGVVDRGLEVRLRNWFDRPYDDAVAHHGGEECLDVVRVDRGGLLDERAGPGGLHHGERRAQAKSQLGTRIRVPQRRVLGQRDLAQPTPSA